MRGTRIQIKRKRKNTPRSKHYLPHFQCEGNNRRQSICTMVSITVATVVDPYDRNLSEAEHHLMMAGFVLLWRWTPADNSRTGAPLAGQMMQRSPLPRGSRQYNNEIQKPGAWNVDFLICVAYLKAEPWGGSGVRFMQEMCWIIDKERARI